MIFILDLLNYKLMFFWLSLFVQCFICLKLSSFLSSGLIKLTEYVSRHQSSLGNDFFLKENQNSQKQQNSRQTRPIK